MSYINETDFVIENKKLVYPEIVADGLQLYYDAKGKRDTDYHRDTLLDMSGNKNHGKLHNFAYEKHSGYKDGLVFDYIDDKLVRPTLNLKPDDFTFMLNGNIISFSPDGTVKRVQDGEVIESKGLNMLYDMEGTSYHGLDVIYNYNHAEARWLDSSSTNTFLYSTSKYNFKDKHKYYISYNAKPDSNVRLRIYANERYLDDDILNPIINEYNFRSGIVEAESQYSNPFNVRLFFGSDSVIGTKIDIKDLMMIDLTESFGAGNEPTKEQMDEIIQRFGFIPNAQDLIDRIEYKGNDLGDMENIIDGLYKTEVLSGEEIYTDKADDAVVHVEVDGNSWQEIDSNNLFNPSSSYYTNGINSGLVSWELNLKPNTIYTASTNMPDNNGTTKNVFFHIKDTVASSGLNGLSDNKPFSLTTNSTGLVEVTTRLLQYSGNIETIKNRDHWIKVEEGESATSFQGYPAPSPDYPVEIHSLNDFDVVSSVGGRNLVLNSSVLEASGLGAISGKRAEYQTIKTGESYMDLEDGETITISFDIEMRIAKANPTLQVYNSNVPGPVGIPNVSVSNQLQGDVGETINKRISFTTSATLRDSPRYSFNTLEFYSNYGSDNFYRISKLKVERGNKATPWTPAPEDILESDNHPLINKINLLLGEPLRSVGNVKDILFRDNDGVWKIERNVGEYTINGTNAWTVGSPGGGWTTNGDTLPLYGALDYQRMGGAWSTNSITNRFPTHPSTSGIVQSNMESFSLGYATFGIIIRIKKSRLTEETNVGFVNWLKENPINVVYELKTSKVETLSQSLQDKLNNIRSFEDSNYVYTVLPNDDNYLSDNLKPTLHAKFLYNNWYKEDRVINNLMIYNRALSNEEMLQNYKTIKRRWGM